MIRICKDEYDRLKRAEIALELIFNELYKNGYTYGVDDEIETALRLVYNDTISALKVQTDADLEAWRKNNDADAVIAELTKEVDDNDAV